MIEIRFHGMGGQGARAVVDWVEPLDLGEVM